MNKEMTSRQAWIITLVGGLFFFYNFIQMTLFNPLAPALMEYFKIDSIQFGSINAGFFLAVGILAVPAGMIVDKFRTKTLLLALTLATVLNLTLTAFTSDPGLLALLRFLQGMSHAFALALPMKLAIQWIAPSRMALASSLIITIGLLGGASQAVTTHLLETAGLHQTLLANAYLGVGIFLLFLAVIRDNENFWAKNQTQTWVQYLRGVRVSVFNPQNWIGGAYVWFLNLPLILLGATWGQLYMEHTWAVKGEAASFIISLIFFGVILGGPLLGFVSDGMHSRKRPLIAGSLLSLLVLGAVLLSPALNMLMLGTLFFILGITTSSQVLVYPMVTESNPPRYMGTSLSIVTLVIMEGNALASIAFSALIENNSVHTAWGTEYSAQSFTSGMWMMWAAILLSLLLVYFMRETFKSEA
jgi:MFS family permease